MSKSLERTEVLVTAGETPKRLDVFLANREPTLSRAALQRLIQEGSVRINGQRVRPSQRIRPGDRITLEIPRPEPLADIGPEHTSALPLKPQVREVGTIEGARPEAESLNLSPRSETSAVPVEADPPGR